MPPPSRMARAKAVTHVMSAIDDQLVVACNGMIGREVFTANDREATFYMIGSMGLALSIGIGVAQCQPKKRVVVIDGDGNVLMGAGVLGSAAAAGLTNLHHIVLDNEAHGSTGDQRTITTDVDLHAVAKASGYAYAERVEGDALAEALPAFFKRPGPAMLLVKVAKGNVEGIARVSHTPAEITARFSRAAQA